MADAATARSAPNWPPRRMVVGLPGHPALQPHEPLTVAISVVGFVDIVQRPLEFRPDRSFLAPCVCLAVLACQGGVR